MSCVWQQLLSDQAPVYRANNINLVADNGFSVLAKRMAVKSISGMTRLVSSGTISFISVNQLTAVAVCSDQLPPGHVLSHKQTTKALVLQACVC